MGDKLDFRVTHDAPLGAALRRYWTPVCLSEEVAEPDGDPVRLRVLGEALVAFRDSAGRVGVLEEACPHRKASLALGRNEGGGLRCLWHQWKFAVDGEALEIPNSSDCSLKDRVRAKAYPVRESGGLVWAYFGPAELEPAFPLFGWAVVPERHRAIVATSLDCNFVKPLEGAADSSHISLLHVDSIEKSHNFKSTLAGNADELIDTMPQVEVEDTDFGFVYANIRQTYKDGVPASHLRIAAFIAPYICLVAPTGTAFISVPEDNTHCRFYNIKWSRMPLQGYLRSHWVDVMGLDDERGARYGLKPQPTPPGDLGSRNRLVQDRAGMREGRTFSGFSGVNAEDAAMVCSISGIDDYSGEHLTAADIAVVRLRRALWRCARDERAGLHPLGLAPRTDLAQLNSVTTVLTDGRQWRELIDVEFRSASPVHAHEAAEAG